MKRQIWLLLFALSLLIPRDTVLLPQKRIGVRVEYTTFIPLISSYKTHNNCSAGYDPRLIYHGIASCAYEWGHTYIRDGSIEIVNSIRSTSVMTIGNYVVDCQQGSYTDCLQQAASRNAYWLIWNEPDHGDSFTSDGISPTQAAQYYRVISDTIKSVNTNSRFVVGNVLFSNGTWLSSFISEYQRLFGADVRSSVYAWGVHTYATIGCESSTCLMSNFAEQLDNHVAWVRVNDPNKNLWLTEFNWSPSPYSGTEETLRLLPLMCAEINKRPTIERRFYFIGNAWSIATSISLFGANGSPSVIGYAYQNC